jgi:hypothetical protein
MVSPSNHTHFNKERGNAVPNELRVGQGEQYKTVSQAVAASGSGDTIYVTAGVYTNDFTNIAHDLKIVGVGGMAQFKATTAPGNGKAYFVTNGNITFENVDISGVHVQDKNGSGIRHEGGDLTIKNSAFHGNEMAITTSAVLPDSDVNISGSRFYDLGNGKDVNHGIYIGHLNSVHVTNSSFESTHVGHHLKSRAGETIVEDSSFKDGSGRGASYAIDLPNGGKGVITGNTIEKGSNAENPNMIAFGEEGANGSNSLTVENNHFVSHKDWTTAVFNATSAPAEMTGNSFTGIRAEAWGPVNNGGDTGSLEAPDTPVTDDQGSTTAPPPPTNSSMATLSDAVDTADSASGAGLDELVLDFSALENDPVDLSAVDADTGAAGDQAFTFIGSDPFSGKAGELHFTHEADGIAVTGDVNGDKVADLQVDLLGVKEITAENFHL